MSRSPKRIVILGGGFAGLYAAMELEKTLARDPDVEITLINRENFFLFHESMAQYLSYSRQEATRVNGSRESSPPPSANEAA